MKQEVRGRPPFFLKDSLVLTLWALSTQETFREIGDRFGISEGHAYKVLLKTTKLIIQLKHIYIVWPNGAVARSNMEKFNNLRGNSSFPSGPFAMLFFDVSNMINF